jgi:hypothetical protein
METNNTKRRCLMKRMGTLIVAFLFCFVLTTAAQFQPQSKIITFDVPGASGTFPCCINSAGMITGTYLDAGGWPPHGFLRAPNGHITTFDPSISPDWLVVHGINDLGMIVGDYWGTDRLVHGFLRTPDGAFTSFDPPGMGTYGTQARSINQLGVIAGDYWDENYVAHGFFRTPDGKITTFDAPSAGTGYIQGTYINSINVWGVLSGGYVDSRGVGHQFLRTPRGTFTIYNDTPDAVPGGTYSTSINTEGAVAGHYFDTGNVSHGFLRTHNGKITEFDPPGAEVGTYCNGINPFGAIVGFYGDQNSVWHGYLRAPGGKFVSFDPPGAGTGPGQGTGASCAGDPTQAVACVAINSVGLIAGGYWDENNVSHGFVRLPQEWPRW